MRLPRELNPGEEIRAADWNDIVRALRALQPASSPTIRVAQTTTGTALHVIPSPEIIQPPGASAEMPAEPKFLFPRSLGLYNGDPYTGAFRVTNGHVSDWVHFESDQLFTFDNRQTTDRHIVITGNVRFGAGGWTKDFGDPTIRSTYLNVSGISIIDAPDPDNPTQLGPDQFQDLIGIIHKGQLVPLNTHNRRVGVQPNPLYELPSGWSPTITGYLKFSDAPDIYVSGEMPVTAPLTANLTGTASAGPLTGQMTAGQLQGDFSTYNLQGDLYANLEGTLYATATGSAYADLNGTAYVENVTGDATLGAMTANANASLSGALEITASDLSLTLTETFAAPTLGPFSSSAVLNTLSTTANLSAFSGTAYVKDFSGQAYVTNFAGIANVANFSGTAYVKITAYASGGGGYSGGGDTGGQITISGSGPFTTANVTGPFTTTGVQGPFTTRNVQGPFTTSQTAAQFVIPGSSTGFTVPSTTGSLRIPATTLTGTLTATDAEISTSNFSGNVTIQSATGDFTAYGDGTFDAYTQGTAAAYLQGEAYTYDFKGTAYTYLTGTAYVDNLAGPVQTNTLGGSARVDNLTGDLTGTAPIGFYLTPEGGDVAISATTDLLNQPAQWRVVLFAC